MQGQQGRNGKSPPHNLHVFMSSNQSISSIPQFESIDERPAENSQEYYLKYWKAYFENCILIKQLSRAVNDNIRLEEALKDVEVRVHLRLFNHSLFPEIL